MAAEQKLLLRSRRGFRIFLLEEILSLDSKSKIFNVLILYNFINVAQAGRLTVLSLNMLISFEVKHIRGLNKNTSLTY